MTRHPALETGTHPAIEANDDDERRQDNDRRKGDDRRTGEDRRSGFGFRPDPDRRVGGGDGSKKCPWGNSDRRQSKRRDMQAA
jgi:hypothetical protein